MTTSALSWVPLGDFGLPGALTVLLAANSLGLWSRAVHIYQTTTEMNERMNECFSLTSFHIGRFQDVSTAKKQSGKLRNKKRKVGKKKTVMSTPGPTATLQWDRKSHVNTQHLLALAHVLAV